MSDEVEEEAEEEPSEEKVVNEAPIAGIGTLVFNKWDATTVSMSLIHI